MTPVLLSTVSLHFDYDLVAARRRARQVAARAGFDPQDQTRIATVASEIARNALRYGGGGQIDFGLELEGNPQSLTIRVLDQGPGIENLDSILSGRYRSTTGMGAGIAGSRRLMDEFLIESGRARGTIVRMSKHLPRGARRITAGEAAAIAGELSNQKPENPTEEIQQQNQELLRALADLRERQDELERLNEELEDTNRGVLALYAELDEKAVSLRNADQLKSRFLSDMGHEFRTPVNSILALTWLLDDSGLGAEETRQVSLIRRAAQGLSTLVEDLLDLAKIEAGKSEVRVTQFSVTDLFSALRGMLRPLLLNRSLSLVFEDPEGIPQVTSDEGKVAQILRNFISNALKFTESGEVRVSAALAPGGDTIVFSVTDTGIGISADDQQKIFEDFVQVDHPLQQKFPGTGLGLPLTRKLAALLGGSVAVHSEVGSGSTFQASIPLAYASTSSASAPEPEGEPAAESATPEKQLVLVIDDDETARYTMSEFVKRTGLDVITAPNGLEGIELAQARCPDLVFLDMMMPGIGGHEVLQRLKADPGTAPIPVVVVTSRFVNEDERTQILGRASGILSKGEVSGPAVAKSIESALRKNA